MMKYVLSAAVLCLSFGSTTFAASCSDIPPEIGGISQVNPDNSITIIDPYLTIKTKVFGLTPNSAAGLCKLINKALIDYSQASAQNTQRLLKLNDLGAIIGIQNPQDSIRSYPLGLVVCR